MFTGIIETLGKVKNIESEGSNVHFKIDAGITPELKVDQSLAHNGVCLTVVDCNAASYTVTAIKETLDKTNFAKEKRIILRGKTTEVINKIKDNSLDFVYIDGDHTLRGITIDLINIWS
ncbi:MAG: riboflavin synthase, partial [Bacteroidota bacterium]